MPRLASLSLLLAFALLAILSTHTAQAKCVTGGTTLNGSVRKYKQWNNPNVGVGPNGGWTSLPAGRDVVCGSVLKRDFRLNDKGLTVPMYISADADAANVERVVIGVQAKGRDSWGYFNMITNARNKAYGNTAALEKSRIVVIVPQFFDMGDKLDGAAGPTDIIFRGLSWAAGEPGYEKTANGQRLGGEEVSTFDVMDKIFEWAATQYPRATRSVVVGHSLGAQQVNRYSMLRKDQAQSRRIDYLIGNPGSWLWPVTSRPKPNASCSGFDTYKFGLARDLPTYGAGDAARISGRKAILERHATRRVHVAVGARDYGPGDKSCEAVTQGPNHRARGENYVSAVSKALGGALPSRWTLDVVPNCSHDAACMYSSDLGVKRLFLDGLPSLKRRSVKRDDRHAVIMAARREADADDDSEE